jgi:hypothetical protein
METRSTMPQERAKFTAEVQVTDATAIYADGHITTYSGPDVQTVAFRPVDRPNSIRPLEMVQHSFKERKKGPLQAVPNETLAASAKFGQAVFVSSLDVTVEECPERFARETHGKLMVALKINYTITVRRQFDA